MGKYFWRLTVFAFCVLTFEATAQVTKGLPFYMNNIEIGGRPDTNGGANLYKGLLDELAVYDRALTAEEVETVMNAKDILTVDITGKLTTTWGALRTR